MFQRLALVAVMAFGSFAFAEVANQADESATQLENQLDLVAFRGLEVVCSARNLRGEVFTAVGVLPVRVQARAVAKCLAAGSARCIRMGCR